MGRRLDGLLLERLEPLAVTDQTYSDIWTKLWGRVLD